MDLVDPDATAAVLLASLTYFRVLDILIGHTPGDVDAERFERAWIEHALATLGVTTPTSISSDDQSGPEG